MCGVLSPLLNVLRSWLVPLLPMLLLDAAAVAGCSSQSFQLHHVYVYTARTIRRCIQGMCARVICLAASKIEYVRRHQPAWPREKVVLDTLASPSAWPGVSRGVLGGRDFCFTGRLCLELPTGAAAFYAVESHVLFWTVLISC